MSNPRDWLLGAVLAAVLVPAASADSTVAGPGLYATVSGLHLPSLEAAVREEFDSAEGRFEVSARTKLDDGFAFAAAIGYGAGAGPRIELELGRRSVEGRSGGAFRFRGRDGFRGGGTVSGRGTLATWSLMANGLYAFGRGRLRPYLGGGVGLARHESLFQGVVFEWHLEGAVHRERVGRASDTDVVFAYQALAGVGVPLTDALEARFGYRFFAAAKADFEDADSRYRTHSLEAGLLCRF